MRAVHYYLDHVKSDLQCFLKVNKVSQCQEGKLTFVVWRRLKHFTWRPEILSTIVSFAYSPCIGQGSFHMLGLSIHNLWFCLFASEESCFRSNAGTLVQTKAHTQSGSHMDKGALRSVTTSSKTKWAVAHKGVLSDGHSQRSVVMLSSVWCKQNANVSSHLCACPSAMPTRLSWCKRSKTTDDLSVDLSRIILASSHTILPHSHHLPSKSPIYPCAHSPVSSVVFCFKHKSEVAQ